MCLPRYFHFKLVNVTSITPGLAQGNLPNELLHLMPSLRRRECQQRNRGVVNRRQHTVMPIAATTIRNDF